MNRISAPHGGLAVKNAVCVSNKQNCRIMYRNMYDIMLNLKPTGCKGYFSVFYRDGNESYEIPKAVTTGMI